MSVKVKHCKHCNVSTLNLCVLYLWTHSSDLEKCSSQFCDHGRVHSDALLHDGCEAAEQNTKNKSKI